MNTIFDKSGKGKNRYAIPEYPDAGPVLIPEELLNRGADLPDVNETEVVRHYTALSRMNHGVDNGMYPLGSCTMKYNPKVNERIAGSDNLKWHHPMSGADLSQGSMQIMYELSELLCKISGMDRFSLAPAAGAHGELTSVMIIKKYFRERGDNRKVILIPDSAHGTNPASVAMCGFEVRSVPSTDQGDVDIAALEKALDSSVAAMMLTSPNTLGLFDRNILRIAELLHNNGSLFYGDGANLNAVMGRARMRDMGFDIMHMNLHKTFSTPHGGGGPGSGPIGVTADLEKYLPLPIVQKIGEVYRFDTDRPASIGRVHAFYGNFLVALKAYVYIILLGAEGIQEVSDHAVLNANYLMSRLKKEYNLPIDRSCMHEFVINDRDMPNHVTTNDIAKRIMDYGFHAPTIYFPLIIDGAMMIEPTETENMASLDDFVRAMQAIKKEAAEDPDMVKSAPHSTPLKKIDAVLAARKPVLRWSGDA